MCTITMTQPKPVFRRGSVVLVLFPNSDLKTAKSHPALVVQADGLRTGLPQLIVAMITSRISRGNHPSRILVSLATSDGKKSGLLTDSVVMTDNLATVAESEIERAIGSLPMTTIDAALRHTLGLD